jgi:hypothetical protein
LHLLANVRYRMSSLKLHAETDNDAEQDDRDDDRTANQVAPCNRDRTGRQENEDQRIGKEAQEGGQSSEPRFRCQAVRTMKQQPLLRCRRSQSGGSCIQRRKQFS